jgi:hypothetical protein
MKTVKMQMAAVMAAAMILTGRAFADSQMDTYTISNTEGGGNNNTSFVLDEFDPSQGTLNSVTLDFDLTSSATPVVFSFSPGTYTGATTTYDLSLTGPDISEAVTNSAGPYAGTAALGQNDAGTVTNTTNDVVDVLPADFADYETPGETFQISSTPFTSGGSPGTGGVAFGGDGYYNGSVSVTFDYTAAPEPSLPVLFSLGLGMVALWNFRMRRLNS